MLKSSNAAKPLSSMFLIPPWLAAFERPGSLRTREGEKDESDPPPNRGGPAALSRDMMSHVSTQAPGGRSRLHLSLREGSETAPHQRR